MTETGEAAGAGPADGARALELLRRELPGAVLGSDEELGEVTIRVSRECLVEVARLLRDHEEFALRAAALRDRRRLARPGAGRPAL